MNAVLKASNFRSRSCSNCGGAERVRAQIHQIASFLKLLSKLAALLRAPRFPKTRCRFGLHCGFSWGYCEEIWSGMKDTEGKEKPMPLMREERNSTTFSSLRAV